MNKRVPVTRRTGTYAFIEAGRSRNDANMVFFSAPLVSELTEGQTIDLINLLTEMKREVWGSE